MRVPSLRTKNLLLAAMFVAGSRAFATADVIRQAADSARQNSQAAQANRDLADQLYKQALQDHDNAWKSFPPNVSLLSKALQESKDAKSADDQAKEFARGAMHAIKTGGNSGDFDLKKYGVLSENQLRDLAGKNSPYQPSAEQTLGKYGMKLTADKMSIQTPLGTLPLNMSMNQIEGGLRKLASGLGYNPEDVSAGLRAGVGARDQLAARMTAELEKRNVSYVSASSAAGVGGAGASSAGGDGMGSREGRPAAGPTLSVASAGVEAAATPAYGRQEELQRNRAAFLKSMGLVSQDPLGASHQDIFRMVHLRYQALREDGLFIEQLIPVTLALAKPLSVAPKKADVRSPASQGPIQPLVEKPVEK